MFFFDSGRRTIQIGRYDLNDKMFTDRLMMVDIVHDMGKQFRDT